MIRIPFLQIDAFTDAPFRGNPAAVCPLDEWLPDDVMQAVAAENNLSETAFFVPADNDDADFDIRWFTPQTEVDLCGHATLAAGYAILSHLRGDGETVRFSSQSGQLVVSKNGGRLSLDFPARPPKAVACPEGLFKALHAEPTECLSGGRDHLIVFDRLETLRGLSPDFAALKRFGAFGYIATAPGEDCDFATRCFFPAFGVDEDPVTGSAYCVAAPYWSERLGKSDLFARQMSTRGGDLWLSVADERVHIAGHCVEVIAGEMTVPRSL